LSIASKRAANILHVNSFPSETGKQALLDLTGVGAEAEADAAAAMEISSVLGGLPLAIVQISQFIRERGYSYGESLELFEKSTARILSKGKAPPGYNHTLSIVWELSIEKLPEDARNLQNLLAFFDSDSFPERLLTNERASLTDGTLKFMFDKLE
jgi:hypothetical protein